MKKAILLAALAATTLSTSAFAKPQSNPELSNRRGELLVGESPEDIVTPVEGGYQCFARYTSTLNTHPVFSVGKLTDQTGKFSNEATAGGYEVTQGLTNEVYSALGELPGIEVAERSDMGIVDNDLTLWKQHLVGDATAANGLRDYHAGQMIGVDYYVAGAITGINENIYSGGAQANVNNIGPSHRVYALQVELDLRLVDARTLRVVKAVKERKTVRGYETDFGVFNFLGIYLFDINAGKKAQEPVELAVRSTMETALLKLVGAAVPTMAGENFGDTCSQYAGTAYGNVHALPVVPLPSMAAVVPPPKIEVSQIQLPVVHFAPVSPAKAATAAQPKPVTVAANAVKAKTPVPPVTK